MDEQPTPPEQPLLLFDAGAGAGPPPAHALACYVGVPTAVADECEHIYTISRAVRLEALRRIQVKLAPYGKFKEWCRDHDENYGSVQYALSQAYGNVGKRAVEETSIGGLLEGPATTPEQTVIQAQADRIRALEARLQQYEPPDTTVEEQAAAHIARLRGCGREVLLWAVLSMRARDGWKGDQDEFQKLWPWFATLTHLEVPEPWWQTEPDHPLVCWVRDFIAWAMRLASDLGYTGAEFDVDRIEFITSAEGDTLDRHVIREFYTRGPRPPEGFPVRVRHADTAAAEAPDEEA